MLKHINKIFSSNRLLLAGYFILSSFIIIIPALFNRYPLFYSDSALYIDSSMLFGNIVPDEKIPYLSGIGYAFFIRAVTWKTTLWLVVFAQALILNLLLYQVFQVLFENKGIKKYHFMAIMVLGTCSSMGWTASQLMPDIFTSYLILSIFLFYTWNKKNTAVYFFLSVLIILSIMSHLSNISISVLIIIILVLLFLFHNSYKKDFKIFIRKTIVIIVLICISFFTLIGLNKKYYNEFVLSPTSHIFFLARLMDTGFMQEFLNEKCDEKSYEICKYKDGLPNDYESFLWNPESVFYKTGGWNIAKNKEYKIVINDVLTSPKYLSWFIYDCGIHFLCQSVTFKIGDGLTNVYNRESSQYCTVIKHYNSGEFRNDFQTSKQIRGNLNFGTINLINYFLVSVSVLIIIWTLINKKPDRNLHLFSYVIFCGVLVNAAATAGLASVFNRFQSRVVWLIPFLAIVYIYIFIYPLLKNILHNLCKSKK